MATWAFWMASLSNPGHLDFELQENFSKDRLNDRLYEQLIIGKKPDDIGIKDEDTETKLLD